MVIFNENMLRKVVNDPQSMFHSLKEKFVNCDKGLFCRLSPSWLDPLAKYIGESKCLEIMSGAGHLAKELSSRGVKLLATDDYSWADEKGWEIIYPVERMDCIKAIECYGNDITYLILSWPYMDNKAYQSIKKLYEINPKALVIFIGGDDAIADEEFYYSFSRIYDEDFEEVSSGYQPYIGGHDSLMLGIYSDKNDLYERTY